MKTQLFISSKIRHAALILILLATLATSTTASAQDGGLDPTFGTGGVVITDLGDTSDLGLDVVLQPDGKIITTGLGQPDESNPYNRTPVITRYNSNGSLDATFGNGGIVRTDISGNPRVALQTDGKLVVGGTLSGDFALERYTSSGAIDNTFGVNGIATASEVENGSILFGDLATQQDGKIVVVGTWETGGHTYPALVARFNEDGTLDEDFGIKAFADGDFPDGLQHYLKGVAIQSDGKIIMSGDMMSYEGDGSIILGRLTTEADPWLDPTFGENGQGTVVTPLTYFSHGQGAIALQADGKIVIAGTMTDLNNESRNLAVARYTSDGLLDTTFGGSGIVTADFGLNESGNALAIQNDGKIVVAGHSWGGAPSGFLLVRYTSDGVLDTTFGDAGKVIENFGSNTALAMGAAIRPDGKILVSGARDGDAVLALYGEKLPPPTTNVTFKSKAASDGWILESTETSSKGGTLNKTATTFYVGDDAKDKQYRSILSFNTASLPDNAIIVSAQVKIKRQGVVGTDPFTTHKSLFLEIRNGLFSNDLDLKLTDFAAAASSTTPEKVTPLTSSWYAANLSSSNLAFVNKYGVTQFRLRFERDDNDDMGADYMKFYTGEGATTTQPELIIKYIVQ
ncbi:MAG: hypothetical protein ACM33V_09725 [Chloroflexota bacterium]